MNNKTILMGEENQIKLVVKYSVDHSQDKYGEVIEQNNIHIKCRELLKPDDIKGKKTYRWKTCILW